MSNGSAAVLNNVSNDAEFTIEMDRPYRVDVEIEGTCPILFHRWSCEDVAAKASAKKGSKAKKTDNIESYVYRTRDGEIAIPTEYLRMSTIISAKTHQDPRSSRKSAMDLFKAGLIGLTNLATTGKKEWDFVDQRRVGIQRNSITRMRPALFEGWKTLHTFLVQVPQYISPQFLHSVIVDAGRLVGVGDFRPSYGRFSVTRFSVIEE